MSHLQLYLHLVWSTHQRAPLIGEDVERRLWALIAARCKALRAAAVEVGGMPDHVHALVSPPPDVSLTRLVSDLKGGSSHAMSHLLQPGRPFRWQDGYGAFTLRKEDVPTVRNYILNQKQHHARGCINAAWEPEVRAEPSRLQPGSQEEPGCFSPRRSWPPVPHRRFG